MLVNPVKSATHLILKFFWTPLPTTSMGHKYILDMFSKWMEAFPFRIMDSETLAKVLDGEYHLPFIVMKSNLIENTQLQQLATAYHP